MEKYEKSIEIFDKYKEEIHEITEKLSAVAQPSAVFSKPSKVGGTSVITASEVFVGAGVGFGLGSGSSFDASLDVDDLDGSEEDETTESAGIGGGGGGGGSANARPVAVIEVNEEGVFVQPIIDGTKVALAFFTTLGSMFFMLSRMRK